MLDRLPVEIFVQILAELPWQDVLQTQTVCKLFKLAFDDSIHLQYLVELGASALTPNSSLLNSQYATSANAIDMLYTWRRSWATLKPHAVDAIPLDERNATFIDLVDAVLVLGYRTSARSQLLSGSEFDALDVLDTKSAERVTPSWTLELVTPFVLVAFDPGQDLLIGVHNEVTPASSLASYSPYNMHVMSFRTGFPHSAATTHIIPLADHRMRRAETIKLQILGDYVAVHVCADRSSLLADRYLILNWRTGIIQLQYASNREAGAAFRLLEPGTFLMASAAHNSFTNPPDLSLSLHTFALQPLQTRILPFHAHTFATFFLPRVASGVQVSRFSFFASNTVSHRPVAEFAARPFLPRVGSAEDTLIGLCTTLSRLAPISPVRPTRYVAFVLARDLLRLAKQHSAPPKTPGRSRTSSVSSLAPIELQWDVWGPQHTRWFGADAVLAPPPEAAGPIPGPGPRYLLGFRALSHRGRRVLDFNPHNVARMSSNGVMELIRADEGVLVTDSSVLPASRLWATDVVSALGYRDCWASRAWPYKTMWLDEHPVGVKTTNAMSIPRRCVVESVHVLLMMPDLVSLKDEDEDDDDEDDEDDGDDE